MQRILSGVRPTGDIHLGNYLGAIRNWVQMQHESQHNFFCIVDLHALTTVEETANLAENTRIVAAAYIAAGINPSKSAIFAQSHVPEHTELSWILSCLTPLGWLNRMTQFKDKAGKHKDQAGLGLYAYPVLMAADILIYKATHVPVGEDQKQHLELARDLAGVFNRRFQQEVFPLPEPMILGPATRVMSLRDGNSKMSKSDPSDYSRLNLMDNKDTLALKIRKAKTDMDPIPSQKAGLEARPEAYNLINIYAALAEITVDQVCSQYAGATFSVFKQALTDVVMATILPLGDEMRRLLQDPIELDSLLQRGAEQARTLASEHLSEVKKVIGMLPQKQA